MGVEIVGQLLVGNLLRAEAGEDGRFEGTFTNITEQVVSGGSPSGGQKRLGVREALLRDLYQLVPGDCH